jgi:hypothetical protein
MQIADASDFTTATTGRMRPPLSTTASMTSGRRCPAPPERTAGSAARRARRPPPVPALAQDRLRQLDDGRVVLTLKSPWADGTRELLFEPLTLLEKLADSPAADQPGALPRRAGAA